MTAGDVILDANIALLTPREAIRALIAAEAERAGISTDELLGRGRRGHVVRARHAAMRAIKTLYPSKSNVEIGRIFGRDHSTVIYVLGASRKRRL